MKWIKTQNNVSYSSFIVIIMAQSGFENSPILLPVKMLQTKLPSNTFKTMYVFEYPFLFHVVWNFKKMPLILHLSKCITNLKFDLSPAFELTCNYLNMTIPKIILNFWNNLISSDIRTCLVCARSKKRLKSS